MRRFWFMNGCIQRIQAESDSRTLMLSSMAQAGGDTAKQYHQRLIVSIGEVYTFSNEFTGAEIMQTVKRDEIGFNELKMMAEQKI